VKLNSSAADGKIFDLIDAAYDRYVRGDGERRDDSALPFERKPRARIS